ncbi:SWI/SNF complex subunit SWI3C [Vitis vinifera]|uniref:SWI/SNF complex subunit SWI3C n=1 Tax=Vitis vinifera TaxID=29760 RepID=A0A438ETT2_VITVI|nr:SWI/SNF complex subunit SWI3C [Vitis vinifera]
MGSSRRCPPCRRNSPSLATSDQERSDGGGYVVAPPQIMEGRGVIKRFWNGRVHAVPMHSGYLFTNLLSLCTCAQIGETSGSAFFSGKSPDHTAELYMECRNLIVAKYMEDPEKRLSVSDCKGLVAGIQEEDLTRIHILPKEDSNGEVHVPSAALKSIDSLIKFDKPKCRLKAAEVYSSLSCNGDEDSDLDCKIRERLSDNRCNYCSRPLPIGYYQSQKEDGEKLIVKILERSKGVSSWIRIGKLSLCHLLEGVEADGKQCNKVLGLRRFRVERNSWRAVWLGGGLSVQIQLWWKVPPWISQVVSKGVTSGLKSRTIGRATTDVLEKVLAKELGGNDDSGRPIGSDRVQWRRSCFFFKRMGFVAWAAFGWAKRFGWSLGLWMGPSMLVECLLFPSADSLVVGKPLPAPSTSANRYQLPRCWQTVTDSLVVSKQLLAPSLSTNRYRLPHCRQTVTGALVVGKPLSAH